MDHQGEPAGRAGRWSAGHDNQGGGLFETDFRQLVARARELPSVLMVEAAHGLSSEVERDDYPAATALRIQHWANLELEGALALLADPVASPAAEVLLRSLLDACGHLHFIAEGLPPGERACRALRRELGMAIEQVELAREFTTDADPLSSARMVEAEGRRDVIAGRLLEAGCEGGPRHHTDAVASLQDMVAADPRLAWVLDTYRESLMAAHELFAERVAREVGDRRNAVTPATYAQRLDRFDRVAAVYGLAAQRFFEIVQPGRQPDAFLQLLEDLRAEALEPRPTDL